MHQLCRYAKRLLSIKEMIVKETSTMMYKSIIDLAPQYLSDLFVRLSDFHARELRNTKNDLAVPSMRTIIRLVPKAVTTQINTDTVNCKYKVIISGLLFQVLFPSPLIPLSLVCIHSLLVDFVACLTDHMSPFSSVLYLCLPLSKCVTTLPRTLTRVFISKFWPTNRMCSFS